METKGVRLNGDDTTALQHVAAGACSASAVPLDGAEDQQL